MTTRDGPRLTWSRLGIGISIGLVLFGAIDTALPHSSSYTATGTSSPHSVADASAKTTAMPVGSGQDNGAPHVAEEFVEATGITDPAHPEGNTAERAALAPALAVPRRVVWPEAWVAEHRKTTVVLDPPGPVIAAGSGQVAVVVTGRTVVTTDTGQSSEVPLDERITLRLTGPTSTANASAWVVTDVGSGS
jgi:hypothetical protein